MQKQRVVFRSILIVAIMLLASMAVIGQSAAGSASQTATANATTGQTIKVGWFGTYIDTLNPFLSYSELTAWINMNVYLPLVSYDAANKTIVPALASSWDINYANHTVIFHLNPSAVWSDGVPVTSADVVYSYHASSVKKSQCF